MSNHHQVLWQNGEKVVELRPLSPRQKDVYDHIRAQIATTGRPPSRSEIAKALNVKSQSSVDLHLKALALKGWIDLAPGARGIRLRINEDVPLLFVQGPPYLLSRRLDPELNAVGRIASFVASRFEPRPDIFLELGPYGMPVLGCNEGEIVALSTKMEPQDLDLVVVNLNDALLCRLFRQVEEGIVELINVDDKGNSSVRRVNVAQERLKLEGVVVGNLRSVPTGSLEWFRKVRTKMKAKPRLRHGMPEKADY